MTGPRSPTSPIDELPETILARAALRAKDGGLTYGGAVTPAEAHALMTAGVATLVDVRTRFENEYVGRVPGAPLIEWRKLGASQPDPGFVDALRALVGEGDNVMFLCRSAVRSKAAAQAATDAGFAHAFDILEGFEGDLDEDGHRGHSGWRHAELPWVQS